MGIELFLSRIDKRGDCWMWTGPVDKYGYGYHGRKLAHRHSYELEHGLGSIPTGMTLDHTCHDPAVCAGGASDPHRRCVRPSHLVIKTFTANTSRQPKKFQTRCKRGHEFTPGNTHISANGTRHCKQCHRDYEKRPESLVRRAKASARYRARQAAARP